MRHISALLQTSLFTRSVMVLMAFVIAFGGILSIAPKVGAETASEFCAKYPIGFQRNACLDGTKAGFDCNDYNIISQQAVSHCLDGARAAKPGGSIDGSSSGSGQNTACSGLSGNLLDACNGGVVNKSCSQAVASIDLSLYNACAQGAGLPPLYQAPSGSGSQNGGNGGGSGSGSQGGQGGQGGQGSQSDFFKMFDQLSQSQNLGQYADQLHENGPNADKEVDQVDNNYGSYADSSGGQSPVGVYPSGQSNSPAIIYFKSTDGSGDAGAAQKLAQGDGGPSGGGANARGYTVLEVTTQGGAGSIDSSFEDGIRAVRHIIENADQYDIDPEKVALWGDSDGGNAALRAAASGKTGAKAAVGWSPITNMYTGMFKSGDTFQAMTDKMSCMQGDPGQGGSSQGGDLFSQFGQILTGAQSAADNSLSHESLSRTINDQGGGQGDAGGLFGSSPLNMPAQTFIDCIGNMNSGSPALYTSPETPPAFLAGFSNDPVVDPQQIYEMRDKLRSLGVRADDLLLEGDPDAQPAQGCKDKNHLCYDARFVCKSINFIDEQIQSDKGQVDCETGTVPNPGGGDTGGGDQGGDQGGSQGGEQGGQQGGQQEQPVGMKQECLNSGKDWLEEDSLCVPKQWDEVCPPNACKGGSSAPAPAAPKPQPKESNIPGWSSGNQGACQIYISSGRYDNARWNGSSCVYTP